MRRGVQLVLLSSRFRFVSSVASLGITGACAQKIQLH
jgi:hypothetical protein